MENNHGRVIENMIQFDHNTLEFHALYYSYMMFLAKQPHFLYTCSSVQLIQDHTLDLWHYLTIIQCFIKKNKIA